WSPLRSTTSTASVNSASPPRMAVGTPYSHHTVGRLRRSVSPSITSSCSSEKLCTSSTATAPGTAAPGSTPAACAHNTVNAGRSAFPPPPVTGFPERSTHPRWYLTTSRISGSSSSTAARNPGSTSSRAVPASSGKPDDDGTSTSDGVVLALDVTASAVIALPPVCPPAVPDARRPRLPRRCRCVLPPPWCRATRCRSTLPPAPTLAPALSWVAVTTAFRDPVGTWLAVPS